MLKRVLHTGVEVANLEVAIALYESLGFSVGTRFTKPEPKAQVAHVKKGETTFELWEFADKSHPQVAFIRNHVAILSDALERDVDKLQQSGYKLTIPITEGVVLRYAFVQDSAGANYEIAADKP
jgi:catechol 2,3-dioxygenase-like lactoylglutathione lyase family enzyme